jgi:hypothetical protein
MAHVLNVGELTEFDRTLAAATSAQDVWRLLSDLARAVAGHRLFTVMTVDLPAGLARRAYTSHPTEYPVSGAKPIHRDRWFDIVHGERRCFVANTIREIAEVFPDHELIASLGCGSVVNLPIVLGGELAATINMLDVEHHYDPGRVAAIQQHLTDPARRAYELAAKLPVQ